MRTVFLGTSAYAVAVLRRVAASEHRPALVVAPPDARRGRGRKLAPPPVAQAARELGLELLQVADVNEPGAVARIRAAEPEIGIVCAFGQLIRPPLLDDPPLLNVHPSLLPRWRGAAPIERAIIAGDERTGVTIMRLTAGLDSGPIALQEEVEIGGDDFGALSERLARLGGELAVRALDLAAAGRLELREQDDSQATYAAKLEPEDRRLDPARPAAELERVVRALNPHIGAYLELDDGSRLGVRAAHAVAAGPPAGELEAVDGALVLGTGAGGLRLEIVQPPGRRAMAAEDYLRGHSPPRLAAR